MVHGVDEAEVVDNIVESESGVHGPLESGDSSQVGHSTRGEKESEIVDKEGVLGKKIVLRDDIGAILKQPEVDVGREGIEHCEAEVGDEGVAVVTYQCEAEVGGEGMGASTNQCEVEVGGEGMGVGTDQCEAEVGCEGVGAGTKQCEENDSEVELHSWIDYEADSGTNTDGEDWGSEGLHDVKINVDCRRHKSCKGTVEVECRPNETNTDEDMEKVRDGSPELNKGLSDNGLESEELISLNGTNNERDKNEIGSCGPFGTFSKPKSMANYKWGVGTIFVNKDQFVDGVRTYVEHARGNLKFTKNDKERVRARCLGAQG